MSKAVMISIRPKWCALIASSKKTIEVRKTCPKIETPFKCYIYCTKAKDVSFWTGPRYSYADDHSHNAFDRCGNGKVIGEFICNRIDCYTDEVVYACSTEDYSAWNDFELEKACIHPDDLEKYADGNDLYGWHISDLVIYDQPKELSEFCKPCKDPYRYCQECKHGLIKYPSWVETSEDLYGCCFDTECLNVLHRPPQSWCYVEELENDGG